MILLIDNYDSFVYNLYQLIGKFRPDITVVRNRDITVPEIEALDPEAIFLSPGPGRPEDSGVCLDIIRELGPKYPIFGVCLGHQAICQVFGGTVTYAKALMHGKSSMVTPDPESRLFRGITQPFQAARYHSLAAPEDLLPACLRVSARTDDGEVMAVEHQTYPIYGVQFHPESVLTPAGAAIVENFFSLIGGTNHD
jgi:anthranilate synthase component 2